MSARTNTCWLKWLIILSLILAGGGVGTWYTYQSHGNGPAYQFASVTRGELTQLVTASGQLNPVTQVDVGSQVSGSIQKLFVDFNSPVTNGQIIAQIDSATYSAILLQAQGTLNGAKAALELAQLEEKRARELRTNKLNSQDEYDTALANLHQAEAAVMVNEGLLEKAQADLSYCTIRSPIDGVVISRNVNVGQTVAASLSAPILFVIANNLAKMRIEAQVSEADIANVELGQDVNFTVDALPNQPFHGKVIQIRNTPTIDQNVVSYDTVIEADNSQLKLKPGMTANVAIIVAHRDHVLKIPNEALRFRLPATAEIIKSDNSPLAAADPPGEGTATPNRARHKKDKHKVGNLVYIQPAKVQPDGNSELLVETPVKTGISDGNNTEVMEGLKEGDKIAMGINAPNGTSRHAASIFSGTTAKH